MLVGMLCSPILLLKVRLSVDASIILRKYTGPRTNDYIQEIPTEDLDEDYGALR
jgi:hypothetical protein